MVCNIMYSISTKWYDSTSLTVGTPTNRTLSTRILGPFTKSDLFLRVGKSSECPGNLSYRVGLWKGKDNQWTGDGIVG
jgi:hypothetical protein